MAAGGTASIGLEREFSTDTTTFKYRDQAQLEMLVKELHGRATLGVQVDLVDAVTQQRCRGTFKIDSVCERFTLQRFGKVGISFGRGDIVAILKGSGLARKLPDLTHIAPSCVAVQLPRKLSNSPLIFYFRTRESAGDFHACLKIFKIMGNAGSARQEFLPEAKIMGNDGIARQEFLPEADNEEPLIRRTWRDGVYPSWKIPDIETSAELEAI